MSNQPAVGIDVGFRQCCIAFVNDKNEAQVIQTDGKAKTPAYASYSFKSPNTFINLVGTNAVNAMLRGQHAIHSPKRILGQHFSHPQVQTFIQKVPFPIINDNGTPTMAMHYSYWKNENKLFHPEEVLAKILSNFQLPTACSCRGFRSNGWIFNSGDHHGSNCRSGGDPLIGGQIFTENILDYVTQRYREKYGGEEYNANYIDELRDICELKKKDLFNSNCENVQIGYAGYYRGNSTITENIFESSNSKV
ncbi:unnamed protein product [Allacma fusca]|uniref:Uncharacterized protein n=1 Tax=Allacma fusca TaxID=39272 RepID=A0A8J2P8F8_9HEXA|nr:unnamed protein product [Allacma fusca]